MSIYDLLTGISGTYDSTSLASEGHRLLSDAPDHILPLLPAGLLVRTGGGKGVATLTPWIAVLDPDETVSPQDGMYLVYLFHRDLRSVTLSLNQGVTKRSESGTWKTARESLQADAARIREALNSTEDPEAFDLGDRGKRALAYKAGNIISITYRLAALPREEELDKDLLDFVRLYDAALAAKANLMLTAPGSIHLPIGSADQFTAGNFAPKNDGQYVQWISGGELIKSRRHESLVREYGIWLSGRGAVVKTSDHPIDMTAEQDGKEWIVEAKVIRNGDIHTPVRGAIGQLIEYAHFHRRGQGVGQLALFTEPIGERYVELLDSIDIAAVWKGELDWEGSWLAQDGNLV